MRSLGSALGRALLGTSGKAFIVAIQGELGAGKTTLVGGVLSAFGVSGAVRSPTYTLIEPYETAQRQVFHMDLYRLADPQEVEALGLRDLLTEEAILLIEWPERGTGVVPAADLAISIGYPESAHDTERQVDVVAHGAPGVELMQRLLEVQ